MSDGVRPKAIAAWLGLLLDRIMRYTSQHLSPFFIVNEHGKRMSWPMLRNRWADAREAARVKAELEKKPDLANRIAQFQFRDIRPKAASEINDLSDASVLLGHSKEGITGTDISSRWCDC
ncbi:hypothetical protein [Pseudomonas putida]|uniref:hypothetical protein n=1 Tax=Pseudomonas putida TaxID=303 RepID=UPI001CC29E35|nr:hypothetical protein [Pseudomonas putida]